MLFPDCLLKHQTSLDSEKMDFVEVILLSGGERRLVEWFALCSVFVLVLGRPYWLGFHFLPGNSRVTL